MVELIKSVTVGCLFAVRDKKTGNKTSACQQVKENINPFVHPGQL